MILFDYVWINFENFELYRCSPNYLQNIFFPNFMLMYVKIYVYRWPYPSLIKILLITLIYLITQLTESQEQWRIYVIRDDIL